MKYLEGCLAHGHCSMSASHDAFLVFAHSFTQTLAEHLLSAKHCSRRSKCRDAHTFFLGSEKHMF